MDRNVGRLAQLHKLVTGKDHAAREITVPGAPDADRICGVLRVLPWLLLALFGAVNVGNALHKGGDFQLALQAGVRTLGNTPQYIDGVRPGDGVTGPPGQGVLFAPFAVLSRVNNQVARLTWYFINLVALVWGASLWANALTSASQDEPSRPPQRTVFWCALLAIILPAQTNFEHQNMNALLLALTGGAAWALGRQRPLACGGLLGLATAFKAFPALLIAYLVVRRQWRAVWAGVATAAAFTMLQVIWRGPLGAWRTVISWLALSADPGWPTREQNQSLVASASRWFPGPGHTISLAITLALVGALAWMAWRRRDVANEQIAPELAAVLMAAAVISPIAWDHYWVLALPAFAAVLTMGRRWVFWAMALMVSGPAPVLFGAQGLALARSWSFYTVSAVVLSLTVAVELA